PLHSGSDYFQGRKLPLVELAMVSARLEAIKPHAAPTRYDRAKAIPGWVCGNRTATHSLCHLYRYLHQLINMVGLHTLLAPDQIFDGGRENGTDNHEVHGKLRNQGGRI